MVRIIKCSASRPPNTDMPNFRKTNAIFDVFLDERISGGELYHLGDNRQKEQVFDLLQTYQSYFPDETLILPDGMSYKMS